MPRDRKLSSDNDLDIKFILLFTAAFVVIASILLVAGYAVLTVTGILGQGQAEGTGTPTSVSSPTVRPTYEAIGVTPDPMISPEPTLRASPTPTPTPTPVPSPYKIAVTIGTEWAGSMRYNITFSAVPGSLSVDMTHVRLTIKDWEKTYCDYGYNDMMYWMDGWWREDNGDKRLDPIGETLTFQISAYSLDIPLDRETELRLTLDDGTLVVKFPLPQFQNEIDPEAGGSGGLGNFGDNQGGSGTAGDSWISDSFDPDSFNEIDWEELLG